MKKRTTALAALLAVLALALTGCGLSMPSDLDGTLKKVSGSILRVGVSENARWVQLDPESEPSGVEPDLVRAFAQSINAEIDWVSGAEHELIDQLKHGELDLVVAGLAADSPWVKHAALTKPYGKTINERGKTVKHVMAAPLGENAFILALEKYLLNAEVQL